MLLFRASIFERYDEDKLEHGVLMQYALEEIRNTLLFQLVLQYVSVSWSDQQALFHS